VTEISASRLIALATALLSLAFVSGGCSDEPLPLNAGDPAPTAVVAGGTEQAEGTAPAAAVNVDTGRWASEAPIPTLTDYLQARQESMRVHAATADLVTTSTFQWLQQQRQVIAVAEEQGWTVPPAATMRVERAVVGGVDAVIGLCLWGPSVDFVDQSTGEPVRRSTPQWHPFDVKMVLAGNRWLVAGAARGAFRCEEEQP